MISGKKTIRCGLIGERLSHSFSPQIHRHLSDYSYELFEMSESEVGEFLKSDRFDSTNVTIPYKKTVMPFLDEINDEAVRIGSVNTITRTETGGLRGDNTDYFGFSYMIRKSGIEIKGKKVLILGTGGASLTARTVSADMGAESITFVSRSGEVNYENVYEKCADAEVVINCTPVGMYPKNLVSPISLERLPRIEGVADMIYNPAKTKLLLDAERLNIKHINGLSMLVAQAKKACELFLGESIDDTEIDRITSLIENETMNIILVGMPGCGKSTISSLIAEATGRGLVDTDALIVEAEGRSIPDIFANDGEDFFRLCEHKAAEAAGKLSGKVIATGGGIVTRDENLDALRQNGKIFFIERELSLLSRDGRPLSQGADLSEMYEKRLPMYLKFSDFTVDNNGSVSDCANEIISIFEKESDT
ncbi:MAG: shikimate kinase [Clostridia bacterium]|nr:shikimate kinase [Clostridia bacterium]